MYDIKLDGEVKVTVPDENDVFAWLLHNQPHSVHYAVTHGGWSAVSQETGEAWTYG